MSKITYTYDDIQLVPSYSKVLHRSEVNLSTILSRRYRLNTPFVASPMDTICESDMAFAMCINGGVGCIHRFMSIDEQSNEVSKASHMIKSNRHIFDKPEYSAWNSDVNQIPIMAAVGVNESEKERATKLVEHGANVILIDVAHGHHIRVKEMIKWCKYNLPEHVDVIAGNIATGIAALDLVDWGADGLRVGIGGGSVCQTRIKTGFGIPNISSIEDVSSISTVPVMADGGIRTSGDIAKAIAVGATTVMLGSLLAGTRETPGEVVTRKLIPHKRYRGSASLQAKRDHNQLQSNIEGESTYVPLKGGVGNVIKELSEGLQSALSYNGSFSIPEFNPTYVVVTSSGVREAQPHLLYKS